MKLLRKNPFAIACVFLTVALIGTLAYFLIPWGGSSIIIDDDDTPLGDGIIYVTKVKNDYTDIIQKAFNDGAASGQTVRFSLDENGNPQQFTISKTLFIPDGLTVDGNGATITVDGSTPFTHAAGTSSVYKEFCIMSQSLVSKKVSSFSISNLNFEIANDNSKSGIPSTLIGIGIVDGVSFTNCTFTVNTNINRGYGPFDLYTRWRNITLTDCTFTTMHDAPVGGVWVRNLRGWDNGEVAENLTIQNCTFNKRSGDEILAIYGNSETGVRNVTVSNCDFNQYVSDKNNPAHLIRLAMSGTAENITFENNTINAESFYSTLIRIGEDTSSSGNISIINNTINISKMDASTSNAMFTASNNVRGVTISGNTISGYAGANASGKAIKRIAVSGNSVTLSGNTFLGNGFSTITNGVPNVDGNYVEETEVGFVDFISCVGNTIADCSSYAVAIRGTMNGAVKNNEVSIVSNSFTSLSGNGSLFTGSGTLNTKIMLEDNTFNCLSIVLNNTATDAYYYRNIFNMTSLDNFKMNGAATAFDDNMIYKLDTTAVSRISSSDIMSASSELTSASSRFISPSAPPQPYGINYAIPVGGIVYATQGSFSNVENAIAAIKKAANDNPDLIVAYQKIAAGRTPDTWKALRAADLGWENEAPPVETLSPSVSPSPEISNIDTENVSVSTGPEATDADSVETTAEISAESAPLEPQVTAQ